MNSPPTVIADIVSMELVLYSSSLVIGVQNLLQLEHLLDLPVLFTSELQHLETSIVI